MNNKQFIRILKEIQNRMDSRRVTHIYIREKIKVLEKEEEELSLTYNDKCKCGMGIPVGFGYYKLGTKIKCRACGRINKKRSSK